MSAAEDAIMSLKNECKRQLVLLPAKVHPPLPPLLEQLLHRTTLCPFRASKLPCLLLCSKSPKLLFVLTTVFGAASSSQRAVCSAAALPPTVAPRRLTQA